MLQIFNEFAERTKRELNVNETERVHPGERQNEMCTKLNSPQRRTLKAESQGQPLKKFFLARVQGCLFTSMSTPRRQHNFPSKLNDPLM